MGKREQRVDPIFRPIILRSIFRQEAKRNEKGWRVKRPKKIHGLKVKGTWMFV